MSDTADLRISRRLGDKSGKGRVAETLALVSTITAVLSALLFLSLLLAKVAVDGLPALSWRFLWSYPSADPTRAGIKAALFGSVYIMGLVAAMAIPVGVGAALYLEEFGEKTRFARLVELNIQNLAAVPSIVYGLLGAGVLVKTFRMGESLITGATILTLLVLPLMIVASREAIRSVPPSLREAAYALGATRWEVASRVVLPAASRGIVTGVVLALSRAIGEAAPLVTIGALTYVTFEPRSLSDRFTVLPIQIFNWISRPQERFHQNAAAAILVLLGVLILFNGTAVWLRARAQRAEARWRT
ncbi:MAG: phosphate ABC transporter permease PtsA [Acidimicrobiia bacterium]